MKGKYFKLKLFSVISFIFIVTGLAGSFFMISFMREKISDIVSEKQKLTEIELLKTKKEIKYIDLFRYFGKKIEVKESDDGYNHIIVYTKPSYIKSNIQFDEKNNKVDISSKILLTDKKYKTFNQIERIIDREIVYGNSDFIFNTNVENNEKILLKLVKPVEIRANNKIKKAEKFDKNLIKNELTAKVYYSELFDHNNLDYNILSNLNCNIFSDENFLIKNFPENILYLSKNYFKNMKISVEECKNFLIITPHLYEFEPNNIQLDCTNVKNFTIVDTTYLNSNLNIKAKNVLFCTKAIDRDILVKYKVKNQEKTFLIPAYNKKNKNIKKKIIVQVDADKIFKSNEDLYTFSDDLKDIENLDKLEDLTTIK